METGETPLVGVERLATLEQLKEKFELVVAEQRPRLLVLAASTGAGKTRLVQELYAWLASEQGEHPYWPLRLSEGGTELVKPAETLGG